MPTVPYKPYSDVTPSDRSTPYLSGNLPGAAFGTNVAEALGRFGSQIERSSDELFGRAMALGKLRNETTADEAISNYEVETAPMRAEFHSLQGRNAVDALDPYTNKLNDLRQKYRDSLPNADAKRRFDASSRGFMGREIFSGAGHAATQNKIWANNAAKAAVDPLLQQIHQNPFDQDLFDNNVNEINTKIDQQASIGGWSDEQTNREKAMALSTALSQRIQAMAERGQVFEARRLLEANRDKIYTQHRDRVENVTQHHIDNTGARSISQNLIGGWAPYMNPVHASRANGVDDTLINVVKLAQKLLWNQGVKVTIGGQGGKRTQAEQDELVRKGYSKTYNSDHLYGRAIDLVPLDANGKENYEDKDGYAKIEAAMAAASARLGIPLAPKSESFKAWDPGHYSLPTGYDTKDAPKQPQPTEKELVDRGVSYAKTLFPDNTLFHDYVQHRISTDYNQIRRQEREATQENLNTVYDAIVGSYTAGKVPSSVEELTADPRVKEAFNTLPPPKQYQMVRRLENVSKAQRREASVEEERRLLGMALASPNEFLNEDILGNQKLAIGQMKSLLNRQGQIRKNPEQRDPQVQRAMRLLMPKLTSAGLTKADRPDDYNMFLGSLQDVIMDHMKNNNNKPPTADEIKEIGNRLLQEHVAESGHWWWPNSTYYLYNKTMPADELEERTKKFINKNPHSPPPDNETLMREYRREQYELMWKKKSNKDQSKVPAGSGLGIGND